MLVFWCATPQMRATVLNSHVIVLSHAKQVMKSVFCLLQDHFNPTGNLPALTLWFPFLIKILLYQCVDILK